MSKREKVVYRSTPIQLSENVYEDISAKVQLLRTCTFWHKRYGKVEITRKLLSEMVENFKNNTRGIRCMIDYGHETEREAAGWVTGLNIIYSDQKKEDQLWADVEWTPNGRRKQADKEYAYLSADFDPNYEDNENPNKFFGAVLLGAGLTNRPVIKKMAPAIQLSEYAEEYSDSETKGSMFDLNKESTMPTEEEKKKEEEMKLEEKKKLEEEKKLGGEKFAEGDEIMEKLKAFMSELGVDSVEDLMKMVSSMREEKMELATQLSEAKEKNLKAEKKNSFDKLMKSGYVVEAQREEVMKLSEDEFKGFVKITKMNSPSIKLSEQGHEKEETAHEVANKGKTAEDLVDEKALKLSEDKDMDYGDAVSIVLAEDKELAKKYREEQNK